MPSANIATPSRITLLPLFLAATWSTLAFVSLQVALAKVPSRWYNYGADINLRSATAKTAVLQLRSAQNFLLEVKDRRRSADHVFKVGFWKKGTVITAW